MSEPLSQPPKPVDRQAKIKEINEEFEKSIMQFMAILQIKKLDKNKARKEILDENALFKKLIAAVFAVMLIGVKIYSIYRLTTNELSPNNIHKSSQDPLI